MSSDDGLSGQSGFEVIQAWQKKAVAGLPLFGGSGHNFGRGAVESPAPCGSGISGLAENTELYPLKISVRFIPAESQLKER
jgi:hypothetical protein